MRLECFSHEAGAPTDIQIEPLAQFAAYLLGCWTWEQTPLLFPLSGDKEEDREQHKMHVCTFMDPIYWVIFYGEIQENEVAC